MRHQFPHSCSSESPSAVSSVSESSGRIKTASNVEKIVYRTNTECADVPCPHITVICKDSGPLLISISPSSNGQSISRALLCINACNKIRIDLSVEAYGSIACSRLQNFVLIPPGHKLKSAMKTPTQFFKFLSLVLAAIFGIHLAYISSSSSQPNLIPYKEYINETFITALLSDDINGNDVNLMNSSNANVSLTDFIRQLYVPTYRHLSVDNSSEGKYTWPDDPLCSQLTVRFGKNMSGAWLLSFPRSGNTWTRYLIESASGFFTGSIYNARFPKTLGFLGEGDPIWRNRTIVTKTHKVQPSMGSGGRPVVMIIRDPARSIVSYWNYRGFKNETRRWTESVGKASYATAGFHRFVKEKLGKWRSIYKYALNNSKRLHVVFYEKLRENPLREIRDILRFLQVRPEKERFLCLSRHLEGNAKGSQRHEDPYSLGEKKAFASALEEINSLLVLRKFPPLPDYHKYDS
ncbi:uncharacterized protein [Macrobrachium rosenbergii]|uniref:uncharacterized protein n=1 Tax=Macrobrachium rosenbergii TaxID=79674 RepID=UPI0034D3C8D1